MIKNYKTFNESLLDKLQGPNLEKYTTFLLDKVNNIKNDDDLYYFATNKVTGSFLPEVVKNRLIELTNTFLSERNKQIFLSIFVRNDIKEGVDILIKKGVDVNNVINCITVSYVEKCFPLIKYLMKYPKFDINTDNSKLLFMVVFNRGFDDEYISYLLNHGANPSLLDHGDAMSLPGYRLSDEIVIKLIERGYDYHIRKENLFQYYVAANKMDMVKYLLNKGVNIKENSVEILRAAKSSKNNEMLELITSLLSTNESLLDKLQGPSKEEIWKGLGYNITFDTVEEFLNYIYDNLIVDDSLFDSLLYKNKNNNEIIIEYVYTGGVLYYNASLIKILNMIFNIVTPRPYIETYLIDKIDGIKINHIYGKIYPNSEIKNTNESLLDKLSGPTDKDIWNYVRYLNPEKMFEISCKAGFLKGIETAVEEGIDINSLVDEDGESDYGISILINNNHNDVLEKILDKYADDMQLEEFLETAVSDGNLEATKLLVNHGADINNKNYRIFDLALVHNDDNDSHYELVKYLLEHDANPYLISDESVDYALNDTPKMKELIKNYIDNDKEV